MLYDGKNPFDCQKAREKLNWLIEKSKLFEIIEKKPKRTYSQNNYIHLLFAWFALEYGDTPDYVKQEIFKKVVNPQIFKTEFANRKTGEIREEWRSTADLDTKEMTIAIDNFRDYASREWGIYLPQANEVVYLQEIEKQIKNLEGRYY
ncbi:hypothetical protein CAPN001_11670 [Capnocytophaga stomatis]|uniref:hypothetical protein n=1 Tax=Capnocytophaga stomatis TaxID=1848904 RepID=UPI00194F3CD2|nr:hypothetical protein [Capnocytophaga stomatis]GIJ96598.1 hypothetical protein CAPN001_11670 [Capnocytophaga stomatis]